MNAIPEEHIAAVMNLKFATNEQKDMVLQILARPEPKPKVGEWTIVYPNLTDLFPGAGDRR